MSEAGLPWEGQGCGARLAVLSFTLQSLAPQNRIASSAFVVELVISIRTKTQVCSMCRLAQSMFSCTVPVPPAKCPSLPPIHSNTLTTVYVLTRLQWQNRTEHTCGNDQRCQLWLLAATPCEHMPHVCVIGTVSAATLKQVGLGYNIHDLSISPINATSCVSSVWGVLQTLKFTLLQSTV